MEPIRNAAPLAPELLERARILAWRIARGKMSPDEKKSRLIGAGHFSAVYDFEDGLVLKVGGPGGYGRTQRGWNYSTTFRDENDRPLADAWPAYIRWTAGLKRRPTWAPRVHHLEELRPVRVYFAVMERLHADGAYKCISVPCDIVRHVGEARGFRDDMHSSNSMYRDNGARVITDPWIPKSHDW